MIGSPNVSLRKSVVNGAFAGLAIWLAYGIVEFALSVAIPQLWLTDWELLPWQWPLIGMLFGVYALAGLLVGALGGAWLARSGRSPSRGSHRTLACLVLTMAFAVNLIAAWPLARSEFIALVMAAVLGIAFCSALNSEAWQRRTAFLEAPVILSLLLLIGPWVSREALTDSSGWLKTAASLLALVVIAGIAVLRNRITRVKPGYRAWEAAAGIVIAAALWTGTHLPGTAAQAASPAASAALGKPNILLITMDTVRADHVSVYGYERDTTPVLRDFAREAIVYERAIACDGFTLPTHACMFTGLYPSWHGATVRPEHPYGGSLPPKTRTLASVLRANGYWTAEVVANYGYLGTTSGLTQGFALTQAKLAVHLSDANRPFYLREGARKILDVAVGAQEFDEYRLRAPDINSHAFEVLDQARSRHSPFFVFLNYMDAHAPYRPQQPFRDRFPAGEQKNLKPIGGDAYMAARDAINAGKRVLDEGEKRYLVSQYDGGIASIDFEIGKLLAHLREIGLYDDTLVVITSDHGEAFGEHNRMEHAIGSVYEDQIHVPLLVKYPGQHESHRSNALVSQVDFMPTVLEVAGVAKLPGLQGQSLRSPRSPESGVIFAEGTARGDQRANPRLRGVRRAAFSGNLKLIAWTTGDPELYNLATDPGELINQYQPGDPASSALMARINAWTAAIPRRMPSQSGKPVDRSTLEKLRSLGYVQ